VSPTVDVVRESTLWAGQAEPEEVARRAALAALAGTGRPYNKNTELAVILSDDERVKMLNGLWRGKDQATNVLSFPAAEGDAIATAELLGDVVVAYETVAREAESEGKSFQAHFTHLVVHGTLHLMGFDHEDEDEAEEMEAAERAVLSGLGVADPYAENKPR
jgi:probable rRNA maturation factor